MRPYQTFHVLEDLRRHVSVPLRRREVVLSGGDRDTTLDVYQQWLSLCVDLGYLQPETLRRDAQRLLNDIVEADVLSLNNVFAECLQSIRLRQFKGFKGLCGKISPHLYHLIKDDVVGASQGDLFSAKRLVQLFSYTSRLTLKDIDLTQQMLEDYLAIEERIPDDYPENLIAPLNGILRKWLGSFVPEEIVPHHSSGGVALLGRTDPYTKYRNLGTDRLLEYAFGTPWWIDDDITGDLVRMSQTIFVPKSYKTFRTISMEPCTLQYFQQGVWDVIDRLVAKNRYLRTHFGFDDASRNRHLAQVGSITRQYATLDLSSASDSVGYTLVKKLFKGTWLLRYIVATRSTHTLLPDGRVLKLKKFAPMGSSLCFPIETFIYAAICEHVTRVHRVPGDYSVYGDDIIVPTQCVEIVCRYLKRLGFTVNTEKSFADESCWFRESCGGEFIEGFDVTPLRVSRKYMHDDDNVKASKWCAMSNLAFERDFLCLRFFFLQKLRAQGIVALFDSRGLLSENSTNYHTKTRWNRNLQRMEAFVDTFVTTKPRTCSAIRELYRYRQWLELSYHRKIVYEPLVSRVDRPTMLIRRKWCTFEGPLDQGLENMYYKPRD